jgi:hypothetical protein
LIAVESLNDLLADRAGLVAAFKPAEQHAHTADPAERLLKFDKWVRGELATRIDWKWAGAQRERRIEQCRLCLEQLVLDLWRRGWLLDGKKLARHIEAVLDAVARQQKAGNVQDFWAYFKAAVNRYVGANAEELREEAMRAGTHVSQLLNVLGVRAEASGAAGVALPELIAQRAGEVAQAKTATTLREQLAAKRRADKKAPDARQAQLL